MIRPILGGCLLILGSLGVGYGLEGKYRKEVQMLCQIDRMISNICCDLQYRMTSLPQLIRTEAVMMDPLLKKFYNSFAEELESQISPNVQCCLENALLTQPDIPKIIKGIILEMGHAMGRFDLEGQLKSLSGVQNICKKELDTLEQNQAGYTKCCRAYCLCAGVLLALILL